MQSTDAVYEELLASGNFSIGIRVEIGKDADSLVEYGEGQVYGIKMYNQLFAENHPCVGSCVSGQLDVELFALSANIPRMAMVKPYIWLYNGSKKSKELPKGVYYVDSRTENAMSGKITLHCYDSMMKTEAFFTNEEIQNWGKKTDVATVQLICSKIGITLETASKSKLNHGYKVPSPEKFDGVANMRKVLCSIGAAYGGNWTITGDNKLRLICLNDLPEETYYLVTPANNYVTFGGCRVDIRKGLVNNA